MLILTLMLLVSAQVVLADKGHSNEAESAGKTSDSSKIKFRLSKYKDNLKAVRGMEQCQPPLVQIEDKCFFVAEEKTDWNQANEKCQNLHTNLFEPRSENVVKSVMSYAKEKHSIREDDSIWIGIKSDQESGKPVWMSDNSNAQMEGDKENNKDEKSKVNLEAGGDGTAVEQDKHEGEGGSRNFNRLAKENKNDVKSSEQKDTMPQEENDTINKTKEKDKEDKDTNNKSESKENKKDSKEETHADYTNTNAEEEDKETAKKEKEKSSDEDEKDTEEESAEKKGQTNKRKGEIEEHTNKQKKLGEEHKDKLKKESKEQKQKQKKESIEEKEKGQKPSEQKQSNEETKEREKHPKNKSTKSKKKPSKTDELDSVGKTNKHKKEGKEEDNKRKEKEHIDKKSKKEDRRRKREDSNKKCFAKPLQHNAPWKDESCESRHLFLCQKSSAGASTTPRFISGLVQFDNETTLREVEEKAEKKQHRNALQSKDTDEKVKNALEEGDKFVDFWRSNAKNFPSEEDLGISLSRLSNLQGPIDKEESKLSGIALAGMESVRILEQGKQDNGTQFSKFRLGGSKPRHGFSFLDIEGFKVRNCPATPTCDPALHYRSFDGSCNNLKEPKFGMRGTPFQRILENDYADGFNAIRVSKSGASLPSARKVSVETMSQHDVLSKKVNTLLMELGQFIDHDLTQAPIHVKENGHFFQCCQTKQPFSEADINAVHCASIDIEPDDPFWRNRRCLSVVRSQSAPALDCRPGPTQQMNQISHWLDLSQVYGTRDLDATKQRSFQDGLLKMIPGPDGRQEMLLINEKDNNCGRKGCFIAGDQRVNENPLLTILQIFFAREHNRIAKQLKSINPHWTDETIYQETRRINIAQYQHIVYNEYLPVMLGDRFMKSFNLLPSRSRLFSEDYNERLDPRVTNEFTTAAFRVGHTMVPKHLDNYAVEGKRKLGEFPMKKAFFNAELIIERGKMDEYLKGMTLQPSQEVDANVVDDIQNFLFSVDINSGLDLIAINVQRGRDHGLPGYTEYVRACKSGRVNSFEDLTSLMSSHSVDKLRRVYRHVDDIDLFIGMSHETREMSDSILGRTFRCIIGDQFARLKRGDRFFYSHKNQVGSFNEDQLAQIMNSSLARIFCENSDGIVDLQPWALQLPDQRDNDIISCRQYRKMNFNPWTDDRRSRSENLSGKYPSYRSSHGSRRSSNEATDVLTPVQKYSRENSPPTNENLDNFASKSKEWVRQLDKSGEHQQHKSYRSITVDKGNKLADSYD